MSLSHTLWKVKGIYFGGLFSSVFWAHGGLSKWKLLNCFFDPFSLCLLCYLCVELQYLDLYFQGFPLVSWSLLLSIYMSSFALLSYVWGASQVAPVVENLPASAGNLREVGLIPGSGRSPREGNGNPLHYSSWENPMGREAWWATIHGLAKSWTWLSK